MGLLILAFILIVKAIRGMRSGTTVKKFLRILFGHHLIFQGCIGKIRIISVLLNEFFYVLKPELISGYLQPLRGIMLGEPQPS
jgi:hypothetical protein